MFIEVNFNNAEQIKDYMVQKYFIPYSYWLYIINDWFDLFDRTVTVVATG